ncbi:hypothetical protein BASA81_006419 [Batrachochytrium salamandrivorans]|nr:hypothetical protein BASA81_006419 [Batrachochytrium salamandrivorans]
MPGLRFWGRRWQVGADDMALPSMLCSLSRCTWIILLVVFWFASHDVANSCSPHVYWFTGLGIVIYSLTLATYMSMLIVSCRGTVLEVEKRRCMPYLVQFLVVFVLCEVAMAVYGTNISIESELECSGDLNVPFNMMRAVVGLSWVDLLFSSCCGCMTLSFSTMDEDEIAKGKRSWYCWGEAESTPLPTVSPPPLMKPLSNSSRNSSFALLEESLEAQDEYAFSLEEERQADADQAFLLGTLPTIMGEEGEMDGENDGIEDANKASLERSTQTWRRRIARFSIVFQCFTCGLFGCCNNGDITTSSGTNNSRGDAFREFAVILAGWFTNLDLVPTDIVAALFLMRAEQREMELLAVKELQENSFTTRHSHTNNIRNRRMRRGTLTSVGRWMWTTNGPVSRATHTLHAQQIRASRDARVSRSESVNSGYFSPSLPTTNGIQHGESFYSDDDNSIQDGGGMGGEDLDHEAKALLRHAIEMAPYMIGMYGWVWFSYMNGIRGWFALCCGCCCQTRRKRWHARKRQTWNEDEDGEDREDALVAELLERSGKLEVSGGGCCNWNTRALVEGVSKGTSARAEVVYASFATLMGEKMPYSVSVDHSQRRVVLAVRGTMTLSDALAHGSMVPAPLSPHANRWGFADEVEVDSYSHCGILKIAAWMRQDLEERDVLHKLFGISLDDGDRVDLQEANNQQRTFSLLPSDFPDCRGYSLELTGHSLGAGVAVVLSLFLRPVFPSVRCTAFAPPGGVFDYKLSNRCSPWVSSVFIGEDFVPRLSWHALFKLRAQILDTLRRDRANKFWAILSSWYGRPIKQLLYKTDEVPDSEHTRRMQKKIDELATVRSTGLLDSVRLYAPGKLLHLMKAETLSVPWWSWLCCCGRRRSKTYYVPMWVDDRCTLDEILLSPTMVSDNFPDTFDSVLKQVVEEYCASY